MTNRIETPREEEPLNEAEAHDEANVVRAAAEGNTAEGYENALKVVEQLKAAAEDEPTFKKAATKILRGVDRGTLELLHRVKSIGAMFALGEHIYTDFNILNNEYLENLEKTKHRFQDAEKELRDMMEAGKKFGEAEGGSKKAAR